MRCNVWARCSSANVLCDIVQVILYCYDCDLSMLLFAHECECVKDHRADTQNSCVSAFLNRVKSADRQVFCLSAKMMGLSAGWATSAIGYCTRVACSQIVLWACGDATTLRIRWITSLCRTRTWFTTMQYIDRWLAQQKVTSCSMERCQRRNEHSCDIDCAYSMCTSMFARHV